MSGVTKIVEFINKAGCYFIATLDKDGQPRVRPFTLIYEVCGKLAFGTGTHKDVYKQITANPKVEISAFDSTTGKWIRVYGKVAEKGCPELLKKAFETDPNLHKIYNDETGFKLSPFIFEELHATVYSIAEKPEVLV